MLEEERANVNHQCLNFTRTQAKPTHKLRVFLPLSLAQLGQLKMAYTDDEAGND